MKKRVLSGFLTLFLTVGAVFGSVAVSDQVYAADVFCQWYSYRYRWKINRQWCKHSTS